jgi:hypothetical protein
VAVEPWHLPVTPAALRRVALLGTLLGRTAAASLAQPAGAASVILSLRLSISLVCVSLVCVSLVCVSLACVSLACVSLASVNMLSIEAFVVDAASAIATVASGMDSGTASTVAGGDFRGGTQAITIPLGGGILHPTTRTMIDS